jgi:hypothetical protein
MLANIYSCGCFRARWIFPVLAMWAFIFPAGARADARIKFETNSIVHDVSLLATNVAGSFRFEITSRTNGKTLECWPTCDTCTKLSLLPAGRKLWNFGDAGSLNYCIDVTHMTGENRHPLFVRLADAELTSVEVVIRIPPAFVIEPKALSWSVREPFAPKTFTMTPHKQLNVHATQVTCDQPGFKCELLPAEGKRGFQVRVTPTIVERGTYAAVQVQTDSVDARFKQITAYAAVVK